jgi:hypothetical protein
MKICAFEAIEILNQFTEGNFDPTVESFVQHLNDAGADMNADDYATLEDVMCDFVQEHVG